MVSISPDIRVPLDEICRGLDGSSACALALDSILPDTTDNRAAPVKPRGDDWGHDRTDGNAEPSPRAAIRRAAMAWSGPAARTGRGVGREGGRQVGREVAGS
ncbi:hypothetical protein GCM10010344_48700 [Streptomyces bluensis]|nr:hypothetical protein GCM10010344_48700 [Streptomyces bluensis]